MLAIRKSEDRGSFKSGWLDTKYSFSFSNYYDPHHIGFGHCRVINDDIIAPSGGFATHGHKDMEILTYVIEGELAHKDSMGNVKTIKVGEFQRMSAGTGVEHSEYNYSDTEECRLLQIWFLPRQKGGNPGYEQVSVSSEEKLNRLKLVVSGVKGKNAEIYIGQDVNIYCSILQNGQTIEKPILKNAKYWLQMVTGGIDVNGLELNSGDGLAVEDEEVLKILNADSTNAEFLLFEMI